MRLLTLVILILLSLPAFANVAVVTYNMAQLKKQGLDLVACTKRRVSHQIEAIFEDKSSPIYRAEDFVLLIQESWTKKSFNALKKVADERGYSFYPYNYNEVKRNGQITISSMLSIENLTIPFTRDVYAQKGMIYSRFKLGEDKTFGAINIHTGFSTKNAFKKEHLTHFEELGKAAHNFKQYSDHFAIGGDFNAGADMKFKVTRYDAPLVTWENGLLPIMKEVGMRELPNVGVTWDETNNALVRVPPLLLRIVNKFKNGYIGWDMKDSTLDHIFVEDDASVLEHEIVFKQKVKLNCGKRDDKDGLLHLSDHYGVLAVVETEFNR